MSIIAREFNSKAIGQRDSDGYINLNQMAEAAGKRVDNWTRLQETTSLLREFREDPIYEGLEPIASLEGRNGGTWAHPDIAIQFAQWCSPAFALQVSRWVREWMSTGKTPVIQPTPSPIAGDPFESFFKRLTHRQAAEILNQVKPICFVPTKGKAFAVGVVSNHVVTDFYDISFNAVRYISTKHRKALESLGLEVVTGKTVIELKKVPQLRIPQMVCKVTTWTPLAVLKVAELHDCPISDRVKALLKGQPVPVEVEVEAVTVTPITPTPAPALPSSELRLAMLERAITLGEKLGGFDERQRLMLRDELINTISAPIPALPAASKATEITISGRANELGYRFKSGQLMKAGRIAVEMYRSQRKAEPPKRDQFVDGAVRQVNVYYSPDDLPIVDSAIQSVSKQA